MHVAPHGVHKLHTYPFPEGMPETCPIPEDPQRGWNIEAPTANYLRSRNERSYSTSVSSDFGLYFKIRLV